MTGTETTPGRAAEPDTMVEVERLAWAHDVAVIAECTAADRLDQGSPDLDRLREASGATTDALLSAVQAIVTERDEAENRYDDVWAQLINEQQNSGRLRTRAETAEARVAILEQPPCGGCAAKVTEPCRRGGDCACFREFHGGSRAALLSTSGADR